VRVNKADRDVFGTGNGVAEELAALPQHAVTLRKNGCAVKAQTRWI
jgi:hypothetical protein